MKRVTLPFTFFATYASNIQVKEDEVGRACSTKGERRNAYRILCGRAGRKETTEKTKT
jgi:hypothetical protein